ncbi:MAG: DUF2218 domain-containing protein [Paracoccus sp. (in: a-proteobacteria)]|nr:DUF2218 domain-containing protein [Paracoccus sp. (in: a-proteobacteria)]
MRLISHMPTERAAQIMATAAKHFAHKAEVVETAETVSITLSAGLAVIALSDGGLSLRIEAADPAQAVRASEVVESHLLRFAHRENPAPLNWTEAESAAP